MAVVQFQYQSDYVDLTCGECGIVFYVPAYWKRKKADEHATFSCPNGHGRVFIGETEAQKVRRELTAQLEAERRQNRCERFLLLRCISHGVCPCCHRTFKQLSAHMATQHPDFVASSTAPEPSVAEGETD